MKYLQYMKNFQLFLTILALLIYISNAVHFTDFLSLLSNLKELNELLLLLDNTNVAGSLDELILKEESLKVFDEKQIDPFDQENEFNPDSEPEPQAKKKFPTRRDYFKMACVIIIFGGIAIDMYFK